MRKSETLIAAIALALVGGCHRGADEQARAAEERAIAAAPKFACASGSGELRPDCTAERAATDSGTVVTIRHADGHFRRLLVNGDAITAADGAQPATVTRDAQGVVVAIGPDRYRLPTVR